MALRWMLLILLLVSLSLPSSAAAQSSVEFETVQIAIWPEYDRPDVLVMYYITLADSVMLPAEVSFWIPKAAGSPHAVAMKDVDGALVTLNYTTAQDGDWTRLTFTTPTPDIQIEYYDPRLNKSDGSRSFEYTWPGKNRVNNLLVQVQQPLTATGIQFDHNLGSGVVNPTDGLTYYQTNVGAVQAGTEMRFSMTYQKPDDALSASQQQVQSSEPITTETQGRENFSEWVPWIIAGAAGLLLMLGGVAYYWQSGRRPQPTRARHGGSRRPEETAETSAQEGSVYCSQCGKRAAQGDVFCRTCGTRLRG
ncbi:MAG TPA: zinc ribbon domain-containing protein [Anaerolineaceae bacterium]